MKYKNLYLDILLGILLLRSCFDYNFSQAIVTIFYIAGYIFNKQLNLKSIKEEYKDEIDKLKGRVDALYLARGTRPQDGKRIF